MTPPPSRAPVTGEQVRAAFDAAASDYGSSGTFFTQIARGLVQRAGLTPGDRVLDAGCGTGLLTIPAARVVGPTGRVTGIDLSEPMLERAEASCGRLGIRNVTLTCADVHDPPCVPGSFDVVVASMMIFLLAEPARAAAAWYRLLRPGGRLAFSWNAAEDPRWQPVIAAVDAYVPGDDGFEVLLHHPPFHSAAEVEAMLAAAGYTDIATTTEKVESRYTEPQHWWDASWSQAPRIAWQHIPENRRATARDDAFQLLEGLRDADSTLIRQSLIGFTMGHRP